LRREVKKYFPVVKVPRQCPLVLLAEARLEGRELGCDFAVSTGKKLRWRLYCISYEFLY
jgi:hypothetical protein